MSGILMILFAPVLILLDVIFGLADKPKYGGNGRRRRRGRRRR